MLLDEVWVGHSSWPPWKMGRFFIPYKMFATSFRDSRPEAYSGYAHLAVRTPVRVDFFVAQMWNEENWQTHTWSLTAKKNLKSCRAPKGKVSFPSIIFPRDYFAVLPIILAGLKSPNSRSFKMWRGPPTSIDISEFASHKWWRFTFFKHISFEFTVKYSEFWRRFKL